MVYCFLLYNKITDKQLTQQTFTTLCLSILFTCGLDTLQIVYNHCHNNAFMLLFFSTLALEKRPIKTFLLSQLEEGLQIYQCLLFCCLDFVTPQCGKLKFVIIGINQYKQDQFKLRSQFPTHAEVSSSYI